MAQPSTKQVAEDVLRTIQEHIKHTYETEGVPDFRVSAESVGLKTQSVVLEYQDSNRYTNYRGNDEKSFFTVTVNVEEY